MNNNTIKITINLLQIYKVSRYIYDPYIVQHKKKQKKSQNTTKLPKLQKYNRNYQ